MGSIRIKIRIPTVRQLGADTAETVFSLIDKARGVHRLTDGARLHTKKVTGEEIPVPAPEESDTDAAAEEMPAAETPHRVTADEILGKAEAGVIRLVSGAADFAAEIRDDIDAICERDPAARSRAEVLCLYSGLHALMLYRASHALHEKGYYFPARLISQGAKFLTGIEIHPGATIGKGLFIDHGSGVVIGETTIIGDNCTLYQGVTLGGTGKDTGKRHPTLGNNVLVGAGAKLLGNFEIGDGAKIAAGAVVLRDVPENCTAVGIPARVVRRGGEKLPTDEMDQTHIPDPVAQQLSRIEARIAKLEAAPAAEPVPKASRPAPIQEEKSDRKEEE